MSEVHHIATKWVASLVFLEGLAQRDSLSLSFPGLLLQGPDGFEGGMSTTAYSTNLIMSLYVITKRPLLMVCSSILGRQTSESNVGDLHSCGISRRHAPFLSSPFGNLRVDQ